MELTKSELEIMDVFWAAQAPLSRSDLLGNSEGKSWKDSSIHILLNGLLQKQAIQEVGFVRRNKTYGRTFSPTITREEYFAATIFSHRHKPRLDGLFTALLQHPDVDDALLDHLQALIDEKRK